MYYENLDCSIHICSKSEIPTDKEILKESEHRLDCDTWQEECAFENGVKWMRDELVPVILNLKEENEIMKKWIKDLSSSWD